jgi:integrase
MRRAEVARLKIGDIDSQRMIIRVVEGKGGKDRDLPLSRRCWRRCGPTGAGASRRYTCFRHVPIDRLSNPSRTRPCE